MQDTYKKCPDCSQFVPSTSAICMYCGATVGKVEKKSILFKSKKVGIGIVSLFSVCFILFMIVSFAVTPPSINDSNSFAARATPTPRILSASAPRDQSAPTARVQSTPTSRVRPTPTPVVFNIDRVCLSSKRQEEARELQRLLLKFADIVQVADSTPRIQLPSLVLEMRSVYRETWALETTLCGDVVKQQALTAMETITEGFSLFMRGSEYEAASSAKLTDGLAQFQITGDRFQALVNNPGLLLTPTPAAAVPKTGNSTANANANLRAGPGTDYQVVSGISEGAVLTLVGRNEAGDWYKTDDGKWIASFLVNNAPNDLPVTND